MPRVSVLLPVRNEERYLPVALRSLYRQTLTDWELVVVNDGSTDRTYEILEEAAARDSRIRVLHRPSEGLVVALNIGLAECRSELVARMDGDDVSHPRRLERQASFLDRQPEISLVACRIRHFPRNAIKGGFLAYEHWQNSLLDHDTIVNDFFVESPFAHPSVMFRKEPVVAVGGYRDMGWAEDYDLWFRLMQTGARFARLPETLFFWRDHGQRVSRSGGAFSLNAFRRCKLLFLRQGFLQGVKQVTLWGAGREGKAWRHVLRDNGITIVSWIEVDPRKIGQVIHNSPVVGLDNLTPGRGKFLVTIGAKGARQKVREHARTIGLVEGEDFICVT